MKLIRFALAALMLAPIACGSGSGGGFGLGKGVAQPVTTIALPGTGPFGAAITPDGRLLFVPMFGTFTPFVPGNTVVVIDTAIDAVVATITVGGRPEDVAIAPNGLYAYVANSDDATVSVIRVDTLGVVATIPLGTPFATFLYGVAITPDGNRAYVTSGGANFDGSDENIFIIDTNPASPTFNTKIGGIVLTGVFSRPIFRNGGAEMVVPRGAADNNFAATPEIAFINTTTNAHVASVQVTPLPGGFHGFEDFAVTPNGRFGYAPFFSTGTGSDEVYVLNLENRALVDIARIGSVDIAQHGIGIRPDGLLAAVANWDAQTVGWIYTPTNTLVGVSEVGLNPNEIVYTPDGTKAYVTNQNGHTVSVIRMPTATDLAILLTERAFTQGTASSNAFSDLNPRVAQLKNAVAGGDPTAIDAALTSLVERTADWSALGEFTVGTGKDLNPPSEPLNGISVPPGGVRPTS